MKYIIGYDNVISRKQLFLSQTDKPGLHWISHNLKKDADKLSLEFAIATILSKKISSKIISLRIFPWK